MPAFVQVANLGILVVIHPGQLELKIALCPLDLFVFEIHDPSHAWEFLKNLLNRMKRLKGKKRKRRNEKETKKKKLNETRKKNGKDSHHNIEQGFLRVLLEHDNVGGFQLPGPHHVRELFKHLDGTLCREREEKKNHQNAQ